MVHLITRAALSAFDQAGYAREESTQYAQLVACYTIANLTESRSQFGVESEIALAYQIAHKAIAQAERGEIGLCSNLLTA